MNHLAKIQTEFLKIAADAKYFLQRAIDRKDKPAISYWLEVIARKARKRYPVAYLSDKEFEKLKERPIDYDKAEVDRIKEEAIGKFKQLGQELPVKDIKPLQELTDVDRDKVLRRHGRIPKYAFTANNVIYLNVQAIQQDKDYTGGLEHVVYHDLGHRIFRDHKLQIASIMNKYGLDDDHAEDFAELFSYKMTGELTDKNMKMYKVFQEVERLIKE